MLTMHQATIDRAWNVQGDPARLTLALPGANGVMRTSGLVILWLGPRSWLVIGEHVDATGGVAFDVSASRVGWTLRGADAPMLVNKHCPLDLRATSFPPGTCAQSVFGHVNMLCYRHLDGDVFTLMVARSFAQDVRERIEVSAAQFGYTMLAPRPFAAD